MQIFHKFPTLYRQKKKLQSAPRFNRFKKFGDNRELKIVLIFPQGHVVFDAQGSRMAWTLIEQLQGIKSFFFTMQKSLNCDLGDCVTKWPKNEEYHPKIKHETSFQRCWSVNKLRQLLLRCP